jgi:hypothetical protein
MRKVQVDWKRSDDGHDTRAHLDATALARVRTEEMRVELCMTTRMDDEANHVERAQALLNREREKVAQMDDEFYVLEW